MQRGFTLLELCVVVAIVATAAVVSFAMAGGARAFGAQSAAVQFDATVAYARSLAAAGGNGATIVFTPRKDAGGAAVPGFSARVFSGRPNGLGMQAAPVPPIGAMADISEASLGAPPFSVFFNSAGQADAVPGAVTAGALLQSEPPCPGAGGLLRFRLSDPRMAIVRTLACKNVVAGAASAP